MQIICITLLQHNTKTLKQGLVNIFKNQISTGSLVLDEYTPYEHTSECKGKFDNVKVICLYFMIVSVSCYYNKTIQY